MHDVLTNAATQIVFNASGEDAEMMSKNWNDPYVTAQHISELSRYTFYSRTFEDNQPVVTKILAPKQMKLRFKNPEAEKRATEKILTQSLMRWSTPKSQVHRNIAEFLAA
jgi:hypothetical protein